MGVPARIVETIGYAAMNSPRQVCLHHILLMRPCSNVQAMCNMLSGCNEDLEQEIRQISGVEIAP